MTRKFLVWFDIIFYLIKLYYTQYCSDLKQEDLILNLKNGKIIGECKPISVFDLNITNNTLNDVLSWKSIPFAQPPVGYLRFLDPLPSKPWSSIRNGSQTTPSCVDNEDCLYLNICTPLSSYLNTVLYKNNSQGLPIFVWIHGDAFIIGSSSDYDGSILASMSNIIVVTINYRLQLFGSLYLENTKAKGYQALKDQQFALKWIYENSASFGGDKNRITIGGESAGSWSVGYHFLLKNSWPYFNNAILQSGTPSTLDIDTMFLSPKEATNLIIRLGSSFNCTNKNNKKLLSCLNKTDQKELNQKASEFIKIPIFLNNDKNFFNKHPLEYLKSGEYKKKSNLIVGYNNYEYVNLNYGENSLEEIIQLYYGNLDTLRKCLIRRLKLNKKNDPRTEQIIKFYISQEEINSGYVNCFRYLVFMLTDFQYKCPSYKLSNLVAKNNNVFMYEFAQKPSNSIFYDFDGASHADEIAYMFGFVLDKTNNNTYSEQDKLLSLKMINYWSNFVKYGKPSNNSEWSSYKLSNLTKNINLHYLRYGQEKNIIQPNYNKTCQFWDSLNIVTYRL